jgi:hypothetical protein
MNLFLIKKIRECPYFIYRSQVHRHKRKAAMRKALAALNEIDLDNLEAGLRAQSPPAVKAPEKNKQNDRAQQRDPQDAPKTIDVPVEGIGDESAHDGPRDADRDIRQDAHAPAGYQHASQPTGQTAHDEKPEHPVKTYPIVHAVRSL